MTDEACCGNEEKTVLNELGDESLPENVNYISYDYYLLYIVTYQIKTWNR